MKKSLFIFLCTAMFCACSNDELYPLVGDDTPDPSLEKLLPKLIKLGDEKNEILSFQGDGYLYEKAVYLCCDTLGGTKYINLYGELTDADQADNWLHNVQGGSPQLYCFGEKKAEVWFNPSDPSYASSVHNYYPYTYSEGVLRFEDEEFSMYGVSCEDQFTLVGTDGDCLVLRSDRIWTLYKDAQYALFVFVKWTEEEAAKHYHIQ